MKARGTSILEFVLVIVIAIAALVGMAAYIRRAISGKWRESADSFGFGRQYDPTKTVCCSCDCKNNLPEKCTCSYDRISKKCLGCIQYE